MIFIHISNMKCGLLRQKKLACPQCVEKICCWMRDVALHSTLVIGMVKRNFLLQISTRPVLPEKFSFDAINHVPFSQLKKKEKNNRLLFILKYDHSKPIKSKVPKNLLKKYCNRTCALRRELF